MAFTSPHERIATVANLCHHGVAGATGETGGRGPRGHSAVFGFLVLLAFCAVAAWQLDQRDEEIAHQAEVARQIAADVVQANREGCERVNVVRVNQAGVLRDQLRTTATLLKDLNGLEKFRPQIEAGQRSRRRALRRLRASTREHPKRGHPYLIDCRDAYP